MLTYVAGWGYKCTLPKLLECSFDNILTCSLSSTVVLCRTSNRSMLARSRSEKCVFVLARSSKLSFFVRSYSLEVRIRVRYSEILAEHINVFRILLHKSTTYLMFVPLDVRISNAWWCSCSKILEKQHSYSLNTRKICIRHNTSMINISWANLARKYFWNIGRKKFRSVNPYTWICWEINFCNLNPILSKSDLEKIRFKLLNENLSNVICF